MNPPIVEVICSSYAKASIDATGSPLTDEALAAAKNADAVILGAIGGPVISPTCLLCLSTDAFVEMGNRQSPT